MTESQIAEEHRRILVDEYCRNVGNTKIKCDDCKFVEDCVDYGWQECKKFTPKPSEPMTNEEYIHSLNTEHLAEWISKVTIDAWFRQVNNELPKPNGAKEWAEWLKQPHEE